jgi:hypothetical protein
MTIAELAGGQHISEHFSNPLHNNTSQYIAQHVVGDTGTPGISLHSGSQPSASDRTTSVHFNHSGA